VLGRLGGRSAVSQTDEEINALHRWRFDLLEVVDKIHALGKQQARTGLREVRLDRRWDTV
jgi:hypothetical protein